MESPRYTTMLAMRLTSLLRGFVYAYFFRVKMVADARIELAYDAYETPFWTTRIIRDLKIDPQPKVVFVALRMSLQIGAWSPLSFWRGKLVWMENFAISTCWSQINRSSFGATSSKLVMHREDDSLVSWVKVKCVTDYTNACLKIYQLSQFLGLTRGWQLRTFIRWSSFES